MRDDEEDDGPASPLEAPAGPAADAYMAACKKKAVQPLNTIRAQMDSGEITLKNYGLSPEQSVALGVCQI